MRDFTRKCPFEDNTAERMLFVQEYFRIVEPYFNGLYNLSAHSFVLEKHSHAVCPARKVGKNKHTVSAVSRLIM